MKRKTRQRLKEIDAHVLLANLYILLVALMGMIRGYEWKIKNTEDLEHISRLYIVMGGIIDTELLGAILLIASFFILISAFLKHVILYGFLTVGGFVSAVVMCVFAISSVEGASLFSTYYTALLLMFSELSLAAIGLIGLWNHKTK